MRPGVRSNFSFPNGFSVLCFIALVIGSFSGIVSATEIELEDDGCAGGTCPSPTPFVLDSRMSETHEVEVIRANRRNDKVLPPMAMYFDF